MSHSSFVRTCHGQVFSVSESLSELNSPSLDGVKMASCLILIPKKRKRGKVSFNIGISIVGLGIEVILPS